MSMRIHTTNAAALTASVLTPAQLVETYGEAFGDVTEDVLAIEDGGNLEAWVVTGTMAELRQLLDDLAALFPEDDKDDRCDYCGEKLGACDYMGLAHRTEAS